MAITDSVYVSFDNDFSPSARYLGSVTHQGGLASGASYVQNATVAVPAGLAGTLYVFVVTNSNNEIYEQDTANNAALGAQALQVNLPAPADLVAGTVMIPAGAVAGEDITITYQVSNDATDPADGSWVDSLYLRRRRLLPSAIPSWGGSPSLANLAPGGSYTATLTAALPGVAPGSYYVILRTNILNSFPELTQSNNLSASLTQTSIDVPALTLGTPTAGTLAQGQSAYYKVVVPAGETLQFALDSQTTTASNELYVSYGTLPTRSEYDFRYSQPLEPNQQVTVPTTEAGTYYDAGVRQQRAGRRRRLTPWRHRRFRSRSPRWPRHASTTVVPQRSRSMAALFDRADDIPVDSTPPAT